jgi:quercetin dioxygenase-like cupin family protein
MHFLKAGDANEGHVHNYDHMTLLAHGSVKVHVGGDVTEFKAPHMIFIKAGKSHFIEAIEDGTIAYCVHALRDKDTAEILDPDQIPAGINAFDSGMAKPL